MPKAETKDRKIKVKAAVEQFIDERPKATLRSMKLIMSTFEGMPSLSKEIDGNRVTDFDNVEKLILIGAQQIDHSLTESDTDIIQDVIDMDSLNGAIRAISNFMAMSIPDTVLPPEMMGTPDDEDSDTTEEGDESKNAA